MSRLKHFHGWGMQNVHIWSIRQFFPDDAVVPIEDAGPGRRAYRYIRGRGFSHEQLLDTVAAFGVRYDPRNDRLMVPRIMMHSCIGVTTRYLAGVRQQRYRDYPSGDGGNQPFLHNFNALMGGGDYLIVVEGLWEMFKVRLACAAAFPQVRVVPTSLQWAKPSDAQLVWLDGVRPRFAWVYVILDRDVGPVMGAEIAERLGGSFIWLPWTKDLANLSIEHVATVLKATVGLRSRVLSPKITLLRANDGRDESPGWPKARAADGVLS